MNTELTASPGNAHSVASVRLDKWLWAARFYKTRTLAKQAIEAGHVQISGARAKVAKDLSVGALLSVRRDTETLVVTVLGLSDQRGGAPQAQRLYAESDASRAQREKSALERKANAVGFDDGRPNKKQRRQIVGYKRNWE